MSLLKVRKIKKVFSASNVREYGFSLTRILPDKDRICDSVYIRENTGQ